MTAFAPPPPRRLIRLSEVVRRTGLSGADIRQAMVGFGGFPKPIDLRPGRRVWVESEIDTWIEQEVVLHRATKNLLEQPGELDRAITNWCESADAGAAPVTLRRILREALKATGTRYTCRSTETKVGRAMARLGYLRIEDKSLPERFRYEKPSSLEEKAK